MARIDQIISLSAAYVCSYPRVYLTNICDGNIYGASEPGREGWKLQGTRVYLLFPSLGSIVPP